AAQERRPRGDGPKDGPGSAPAGTTRASATSGHQRHWRAATPVARLAGTMQLPARQEMPAVRLWRKREDPAQRTLAQRLTTLPLFVGLEHAALEALVAELEWLALPGGTLLFDQGEAPDALYVLLYGRL